MKNIRILFWLVGMFFSLCYAEAQESHWNCNIYNFQYDMTFYIGIQKDGSDISDLNNYELAAFCDDECRGVASVEIIPGTSQSYYYLRVRSNKMSGETISFKCYDKIEGEEIAISKTEDFVSDEQMGLPSSLYLVKMTSAIPGDVNGDGDVDVQDVTDLIGYILGESSSTFVVEVADVNGDGDIDVQDAIDLIDRMLNN